MPYAAKREIMPGVEHRQHKGLNYRTENSHQPRPSPIIAMPASRHSRSGPMSPPRYWWRNPPTVAAHYALALSGYRQVEGANRRYWKY